MVAARLYWLIDLITCCLLVIFLDENKSQLAELFLHAYEAGFLQWLLKDKDKTNFIDL